MSAEHDHAWFGDAGRWLDVGGAARRRSHKGAQPPRAFFAALERLDAKAVVGAAANVVELSHVRIHGLQGPTAKTDVYERALRELTAHVQALREEVDQLKSQAQRVVVIREVTRDEAKQLVLAKYQSTQQEIYPSDVALELCLEPELVQELTDELVAEGRLE